MRNNKFRIRYGSPNGVGWYILIWPNGGYTSIHASALIKAFWP